VWTDEVETDRSRGVALELAKLVQAGIGLGQARALIWLIPPILGA
jgi:hypothetical protein